MKKLFKETIIMMGIVFGASYAISDYRLIQRIGMMIVAGLVYFMGQVAMKQLRQTN
ncbi:hypothetical protein [Streptococcus sp. S784/96/1]|uniref:hypothetical protein n=1 Tax=Streptococcus sp. S784/96/1 TaxID=2653499 RepID=UPI001389536F|nr:hypothetical protein [Streptococcus sp. S784/96/1]